MTPAQAADAALGRAQLPLLQHRWIDRGASLSETAVAEIARELHLPSAMCRLLVRRGIDESAKAREFLKPDLQRLHDPFLLTDMNAAVARIWRAIDNGEQILVHGDYDVDGICAATLYTRVLRSLGATATPFVPHRLEDGYDLGRAGVRAAADAGATLIVTGDCGIVAHEPIAAANSAGIDVVVTDHHTPGATLPAALAIVNPHRAGDRYPFRELCGTGVAFKVCQALLLSRGHDTTPLRWYLDLVALATIADLVPLVDENRTFAHFGLRLMPQTRNAGVRALLRSTGLADRERIGASQVSHVLAPRINAVGRMGDAARGVRLLLADTESEAESLAALSESENDTRRAVDKDTLEQALDMLCADYDPARDYAIVLAAQGWHPGVIGIVASRIVEQVHRPTVLIALDGESGRGSARSIRAFDLYGGIHACGSLLERYGGHHQAAGLEIRADRIDAFRAALNAHARTVLRAEDLVPELATDLEIRLDEATVELFRLLRHLGPHGMGNPAPVFVARGVSAGTRIKYVGEGHVRLRVEQHGVQLNAIGFRLAACARNLDLDAPIDIVFQLQEDTWNGRSELQARLLDLRQSGA